MNVDPQKSETRPDAKSEATSSQKLTPTAFRAKHSEVYSTMCDLADLVSALEQNINDDVELRSVVFHHPPRETSNDWRLLDPVAGACRLLAGAARCGSTASSLRHKTYIDS